MPFGNLFAGARKLLQHAIGSVLEKIGKQESLEGNEKPITARISFRLTAVAFAVFLGYFLKEALFVDSDFSIARAIGHVVPPAAFPDKSTQAEATPPIRGGGDAKTADPVSVATSDAALYPQPAPSVGLPQSKSAPKPPKLDEVAKLLAESKDRPALKPKSDDERAPPQKTPDLSDVAKLLSRDAPESKFTSGREISRTAALGAPNATGAKMPPSLSDALNGLLKDQYRQCWNYLPMSGGAKYVAKIKVSYLPDGSLAGQPVLLNPPSDPSLRGLAESALRAVRRCNPLRIPAQYQPYYDQWKDWAVGFDPEIITNPNSKPVQASFPLEFDCNADYWTGNDPQFRVTLSVPGANAVGRSPFTIRHRGLSLDGNIEFGEDGFVASIKAVGSLDGKAKELILTPSFHDDQRVTLTGSLQPPGDRLMGRHCEATYYVSDLRGQGRLDEKAASAPTADKPNTVDKQRDFGVKQNLTLVGQCRFTTHNQFPSKGLDKSFDNDCSKIRIVTYAGSEHRMSVYIYNNVGIESRRLDGFMFYDPLLKHNGIMVQSVTAFGADFQYRVEPRNGSCLFTVSNGIITYAGCDLRYQVGDKVIDQNTDSIAFSPAQQTGD